MSHLLIFSQSVTGHYLEYLHHLYCEGTKHPELKITIVAPELFNERKLLLQWPKCENIFFDLQSDRELSYRGNWLWTRLRFALVLRRCIKKHQPDRVFVLAYLLLMPFVTFVIPYSTKLSGILYELYVYRWKRLSFCHKFYEVVLHWFLVNAPQVERILLLNDKAAPRLYNRLYRSDKFHYLPDPVLNIPFHETDFRNKYQIAATNKVFLHFGSMGVKKGTLLILKTIGLASAESWRNKTFVFAGKIPDDIRIEFDKLLALANKKAQVLVFPGFCSYEDLCNWCRASNVLLVPYLETYNSSGCIGYAARFGIPVISSAEGLLGKLVKRFKLGKLIISIDETKLLSALMEDRFEIVPNYYLSENTSIRFAQICLQ